MPHHRPKASLTTLLTALSLLSLLTTTACERDEVVLSPLDGEKIETRDRDRVDPLEDQAYVAPVDLELDWALANQLVPADREDELVARVRIQAPEALDLPRPPARVVLVVDTSASMRGEAIAGAKRAAAELVDALAEGDSFALVVFHSRAEVLMQSTIIGEHSRAAAKAEIEKMQAWGTTDLAGGMRLALDQLSRAPVAMDQGELVELGRGVASGHGPDPAILERVVLLGDGVPNDPGPISGSSQQFAARGVELTALGYGLEYDETLLASLAEQTHGHFAFVDEPDAVAELFRDEVLHIQRTVARDLRLALGPGPGVRILEIVGHTPQWNPSTNRLELALGSIAEGQQLELIVRLGVGPHAEGATVELSDLELGYADVYTGTGNRFERAFLAATASADPDALAAAQVPEIARAGARARTSAATLQVLQLARGGETKQAKQLLRAAVDWASQRAEALEDERLAAQAEELAALEPELASLAPKHTGPHARYEPDAGGSGASGASEAPAFAPAPPPPSSPEAARKVRKAHSEAFNDLH
ncbi:VWA domain-containing protein [Pseudenhygromyxa sp. WMMC2535]|uniref:vWA domain-containing protein n=1 Tax=Pseudenhygromyxa sp. WMMC2535 TaxID=2712867 RepID=UPI001553F19B|nr:VWA domain-containing protein [Pseudenhygromyxa sp. WMMC2535]NVB37606.1 VWA domain-containing protein [Pseudenhygromyxa sp. WMMC2535]